MKVRRWGNSLAVRIPKAIARKAGVEAGTTVEIEAERGGIIARPVHAYTLDGLLSRVRAGNLHAEVSSGPPRGREAW